MCLRLSDTIGESRERYVHGFLCSAVRALAIASAAKAAWQSTAATAAAASWVRCVFHDFSVFKSQSILTAIDRRAVSQKDAKKYLLANTLTIFFK
jgi:hypothetical protein